jgi:hypothetical protein
MDDVLAQAPQSPKKLSPPALQSLRYAAVSNAWRLFFLAPTMYLKLAIESVKRYRQRTVIASRMWMAMMLCLLLDVCFEIFTGRLAIVCFSSAYLIGAPHRTGSLEMCLQRLLGTIAAGVPVGNCTCKLIYCTCRSQLEHAFHLGRATANADRTTPRAILRGVRRELLQVTRAIRSRRSVPVHDFLREVVR